MPQLILGAIPQILNLLFLFQILLPLRMEHQALLIHHILQYLFCRFEIIPLPVKYLFTNWLLLVVVQPVEIWVA
jgi:hypothetical protein